MVPVSEALGIVLRETAKSLWFEKDVASSSSTVSTTSSDLVGQIPATDIRVPQPGYPNYSSSIMDGFAIKTSDLAAIKKRHDSIINEEERINFTMDFRLEGKIFAGDSISCENKSGSTSKLLGPTAVYVTTGAVVPYEYDAVIPVEDTVVYSENFISRMRIINNKVSSVLATTPGTWIRTIGCDIAPDSIVLGKGERIQPVHMALLAQCGVDELPVKCLPKVGILSTGNELSINYGQCQDGKIPDANRPLLLSQLTTYCNCKPLDLGIVSDDDSIEILSDKLKTALWIDNIDVLISTGGISAGEKDNMERVFVEGMGGDIHFGRLNMKPGKPTTFITIDKETSNGKICRKLVFALPGNPVSASVCTELLVRPCLDLLYHGVDTSKVSNFVDEQCFIRNCVDNAYVHDELMATLTADVSLDKERPEYHRVSLQRALTSSDKLQYSFQATSTGVQRSSRVLSLRSADGLMMLPQGGQLGCAQNVAQKGMAFPVLLYHSSVHSMRCGIRFKDSIHGTMFKSKIEPSEKLCLGVVFCTSGKEKGSECLEKINTTLMNSLGGEDHVKLVNRVVCNTDSVYDVIAQRLNEAIFGSDMESVNVIFVVVLGESCQDSTSVPFQTGLDVSHALRQMVTKRADAMAIRLRKAAASQDVLAALFENVVGLVRNNSSVLISCSDRGLDEVGTIMRRSLCHLAAMLKK